MKVCLGDHLIQSGKVMYPAFLLGKSVLCSDTLHCVIFAQSH